MIPFIKIRNITLPNKPLDNFELADSVKKLKIPFFRGVFLRDTLPKRTKRRKQECGILNLDDTSGEGTHWVCWFRGDTSSYFDSFGLPPPLELEDYLKQPIFYNTEQVQPRDQVFCGHLCLYVLKEMSEGKNLQEVVNLLY